MQQVEEQDQYEALSIILGEHQRHGALSLACDFEKMAERGRGEVSKAARE